MIAYLAVILALVGLLMWLLSSNAKVAEIGKILFFCGTFVTTMRLGEKTVHLF